MRMAAVALICLAGAGLGRRTHVSGEKAQDGWFERERFASTFVGGTQMRQQQPCMLETMACAKRLNPKLDDCLKKLVSILAKVRSPVQSFRAQLTTAHTTSVDRFGSSFRARSSTIRVQLEDGADSDTNKDDSADSDTNKEYPKASPANLYVEKLKSMEPVQLSRQVFFAITSHVESLLGNVPEELGMSRSWTCKGRALARRMYVRQLIGYTVHSMEFRKAIQDSFAEVASPSPANSDRNDVHMAEVFGVLNIKGFGEVDADAYLSSRKAELEDLACQLEALKQNQAEDERALVEYFSSLTAEDLAIKKVPSKEVTDAMFQLVTAALRENDIKPRGTYVLDHALLFELLVDMEVQGYLLGSLEIREDLEKRVDN